MRKQRLLATEQAAQNQQALKAKLIDELQKVGDAQDEHSNQEEKDENAVSGTEIQPYYPPSYYDVEESTMRIKVTEDPELRRKKKAILAAFNAKKDELKSKIQLNLTKPPLPLEVARKRAQVQNQRARKASDVESSATDDGFRNYEENKAKMSNINQSARASMTDKTVEEAVQSIQLNEIQKRNQEYKRARAE